MDLTPGYHMPLLCGRLARQQACKQARTWVIQGVILNSSDSNATVHRSATVVRQKHLACVCTQPRQRGALDWPGRPDGSFCLRPCCRGRLYGLSSPCGW